MVRLAICYIYITLKIEYKNGRNIFAFNIYISLFFYICKLIIREKIGLLIKGVKSGEANNRKRGKSKSVDMSV